MRDNSNMDPFRTFTSLVQDLSYMFPWRLAGAPVMHIFKPLFERGLVGAAKGALKRNVKGNHGQVS